MTAEQHFTNVDLQRDESACWIVKDEVVTVAFATADGELQSAVGPNRFVRGDALLTGSTGDRWSVSRSRFDAKYVPDENIRPGDPGRYRNLAQPLRGRCLDMSFSVERCVGGDVLHGAAGDWLVEYAPGDHGIIARSRFDRVYRLIPGAAEPAAPGGPIASDGS